MVVSSFKVGDYKIIIKKLKLGYTYIIQTKIKDKLTIVGRSYVYYNLLDDCTKNAYSNLEQIMCVSSLFNL